MKKPKPHWTKSSTAFHFAVSQDFVSEIEQILDAKDLAVGDLARRVGVFDTEIWQKMDNPHELSLKEMIKWARALGLKLAVIVYDDEDAENERGPIFSGVFRDVWEKMGRPKDAFELKPALVMPEPSDTAKIEPALDESIDSVVHSARAFPPPKEMTQEEAQRILKESQCWKTTFDKATKSMEGIDPKDRNIRIK